jgi:phosphate transport system protein
MGDLASRITDDARGTLRTCDALDAAGLEVDNDSADGLSRALFRALLDNWSHDVKTAVNVALLGRYYERLADHALALAQSAILMVAGTKVHIGAPQVD